MTEERLAAPPGSRLRWARRHRNRTLARVVQEIDERMAGSGVTESLVSAWELGRRKTSLRYRGTLCSIYGMPTEELFADQDGPDVSLALVAGPDWTAHVVMLPSLTTAGNFDCGVLLLDPSDAQSLVQHGKQLYPGMRKLETLDAVRELRVLQ